MENKENLKPETEVARQDTKPIEKESPINDKAIKKLRDEEEKAKDPSFATIIITYLIERCKEDPSLIYAVISGLRFTKIPCLIK